MVYIPNLDGLKVTLTLYGYNNQFFEYIPLDINYLPIEELDKKYKLADGSVTTDKLADNSVTTDKLADNSVTGAKFETPYNLYELDITEQVSVIYQDLGKRYNKIRVKGEELWLQGSLDDFTLYIGGQNGLTAKFEIDENTSKLQVMNFVIEMTVVGQDLRIDFCYSFGNSWKDNRQYLKRAYCFNSELKYITIGFSATGNMTFSKGNIAIDCLLT